MGDMRKIIDQTIDEMVTEGLLYGDEETNAQVAALLWRVWEASYRDGYKDGAGDLAGNIDHVDLEEGLSRIGSGHHETENVVYHLGHRVLAYLKREDA